MSGPPSETIEVKDLEAAEATHQGELWPRYEPGEELGPLMRGLSGGLIGGIAALGVDWVIGMAIGVPWLWPSLAAMAGTSRQADVRLGGMLVLAFAVAAALVFVFGEFRRFVPGPGVAAGAVWGVIVWLVAAPLVLPYWVGLERASDSPVTVFVLAALAVGQSVAAAVAYGAVVGWMNPRRDAAATAT